MSLAASKHLSADALILVFTVMLGIYLSLTHPARHRAEAERSTSPGARTAMGGQVIGNRNSRIYHRPDCPDYGKVSEKNRVLFGNVEEAERAGFRQARNCR